MRGKPPGSVVGIYYDTDAVVVVGDVIESDATGRRWLVDAARQQTRGKHAGRWHLSCVVLAPGAELDPDAVVHPLCWYPRD